ncbi:MAG: molybdopterin molybdotransferase MoeA, partial [Planctomycetaceae bacterium]|nr:molybdopterin molybdotransferase MoeA [Planctomycetaceae bacterium]
MISVSDALELCLSEATKSTPFSSERLPLRETLGRVVAEDVLSDIDSPPFDKALMDGFAVRSADLKPEVEMIVIEEITAGNVPTKSLEPRTATRIMTGAPLPNGADAVVRVEDSVFDSETMRVQFTVPQIESGQSILRRASSIATGDTILSSGHFIRAQEIGVLAELGKAEIAVRKQPRIAVLATGDELVAISETPQPGQIRNSNEEMLAAQITRAGGVAEKLGIARDERVDLAEKIQTGLRSDLLILSGGVSAGTLDLVPSELANAGVREIFHKVNVKPGKPVWFGVKEDGDARCLVFGLPGNPVSSMVCFE